MTKRSASRREFLTGIGVGAVAAGVFGSLPQWSLAQAPAKAAPAPTGPFTLPALPYAYDALEPSIDAETMKIHHDKHHQAYVNNLNAALAGHAGASKMSIEQILKSLDKLPDDIRDKVRNNGGGHYNHTLFWEIMGPGKGGEPKGKLLDAITATFGGYAGLKEKMSQAAIGRFGSGWAWLSVDKDGKLVLESLPNQDSPISAGKTPILGIDVWEHAYYLKYRNLRPDYVAAWWNVVNWDTVGKKFSAATMKG